MKNKIGKDQSLPREVNNSLVIKMLEEGPKSATEMASELSLSNATLSSIIKDLSALKLIRIKETSSVNGYGRKRVIYEINADYGLSLAVNISNFHALISLIDTQKHVVGEKDISIARYNEEAITTILEEAHSLYAEHNERPIKNLILSLPGRVAKNSGELALSKQFDKDLFKEKNYLHSRFSSSFGDIPIIMSNDTNVKCIGEMKEGKLSSIQNAVYLSVDYGVGSSLVIEGNLFLGDEGYAGEFGLFKHYDGKRYEPIDEFISLRALIDEASTLLNRPITRDELFDLYETNEEVRNLVLDSASILGKAISTFIETMDIGTFVISGRITRFGNEYLDKIRQETSGIVSSSDISFASLNNEAEVIGSSYIGVERMLSDALLEKGEA